MPSKSDWILSLYKEYIDQKKHKPIFPSDWDTVNDKAAYPSSFIQNSLRIETKQTLPYTFSDEQQEIKTMVLDHLPANNICLNNLAVSISSTAAIYLTILSLWRQGVIRFLLFTPVYYSIIETLEDLGAEIYYYNLLDKDDFEIDVVTLQRMMTYHKIEALVVTDPIYCVGKKIAPDILNELVYTCNQNNSWFILDNTLGGMSWESLETELFDRQQIDSTIKAEKYIIIDSLTKRMLINGLKHAIIISNDAFIEIVEDAASQVYGGFCFPQLQLMRELYDSRNKSDVTGLLQHNIQLIKDNYSLLTSFLKGSFFELYNANSGYYTMIKHKTYLCSEVNIEAQIKRYLYKFNSFLLPPWYFNFDDRNHFAIRVNLLKEPSLYLSALENCIRENIELLH